MTIEQRIVRCEVLAQWQGLALKPAGQKWKLVPLDKPQVVEGDGRPNRARVRPVATGLTLDEVELRLAPVRRWDGRTG